MTTTLHSTIHARLGWTWRDRVGLGAITDSSRMETKINLGDGAGACQADAVWHAEDQVLDEGQCVNFELDGLEQTIFGSTVLIRLAQVKALLVVNKSTTGGSLVLGGASVDEWHAPFGQSGGTMHVMPGSPLLLASCRAGWPVDAAHAVLRATAVGGSVTFDIVVLGALASASSSSDDDSSSGDPPSSSGA